MNKKIEIPVNKIKTLLLSLGSTAFILISIWLLFDARFSMLAKGIAIVGVLFFGATLIVSLKIVVSNTSGLVIEEQGITFNTTGLNVGLIKWEDILSIERMNVSGQQFLNIQVSNPEQYISRAKGLKRKTLEMNHTMYGTPLSISAVALQVKFNDLENLLKTELTKHNHARKS